jgi:uncharacterized membrane protein YkoI
MNPIKQRKIKQGKLISTILGSVLLAFVCIGSSVSLYADDHREHHKHGEEDEEYDHDRALEAVRRGEVIPLEKVLASLRVTENGTVVSTKLEHEGDKWIYEFKMIGQDGRLRKICVDAHTGAVLKNNENEH